MLSRGARLNIGNSGHFVYTRPRHHRPPLQVARIMPTIALDLIVIEGRHRPHTTCHTAPITCHSRRICGLDFPCAPGAAAIRYYRTGMGTDVAIAAQADDIFNRIDRNAGKRRQRLTRHCGPPWYGKAPRARGLGTHLRLEGWRTMAEGITFFG
jgi:hypothetical protein